MSGKVQHIETPTHAILVTDGAVATVQKYTGPSPVQENMPYGDAIGWWGPDNLWPQNVIKDIETYALMGNVIEKKNELLTGGGIQYGKMHFDQRTGVQVMERMLLPEIEDFFEAINADLYLAEAGLEWNTYANLFVEFRMGRGFDRITGFAAHDSSHMRLGKMNEKAEITEAFLGDWGGGITANGANKFPALDPYRNVHGQMLSRKESRWIMPIRYLTRGQFYYGKPSWDGLRIKWVPIAKRIPELKEILIRNIAHMPWHLEFDERYFMYKYKDWAAKNEKDRIDIVTQETRSLGTWLKGDGQGSPISSVMKANAQGDQQLSLLKIHQHKINMAEGAYIEDSQEADFVVCRDMGLKPSLIGISPSKSGSSPGSGSEDRVARTNHILGQTLAQKAILKPFYVAKKMNGWPEDIHFQLSNYYVATLDRTSEVSGKPNDNPER
jgi:hypothetical protein